MNFDADEMWSEASSNAEAAAQDRALTEARVAAANSWPFLAGADSEVDFENRLALLAEQISTAASHGANDLVPIAEVRTRLVASLRDDFKIMRTAAEGSNTCSVCGDAIAKNPDGDGYHHDNGEKHDHEAKAGEAPSTGTGNPFPGHARSPYGGKESSRKTAVSLDDIKNTNSEWKRVTWQLPDGGYEFTHRLMHRPGYSDEHGERFTSADNGMEVWLKPENIKKIEDDGPTTDEERRGRDRSASLKTADSTWTADSLPNMDDSEQQGQLVYWRSELTKAVTAGDVQYQAQCEANIRMLEARTVASLHVGQMYPSGIVADGNKFIGYGSVLVRDKYPRLFEVMKTAFNTGNEGPHEFRLPEPPPFVRTAGSSPVARWESGSGKHWVELHADDDGNHWYRSPGAGGNMGKMNREDAISEIQKKVEGHGIFDPDAAKTTMKRVSILKTADSTDPVEHNEHFVFDGDTVLYHGSDDDAAWAAYHARRSNIKPEFQHRVTMHRTQKVAKTAAAYDIVPGAGGGYSVRWPNNTEAGTFDTEADARTYAEDYVKGHQFTMPEPGSVSGGWEMGKPWEPSAGVPRPTGSKTAADEPDWDALSDGRAVGDDLESFKEGYYDGLGGGTYLMGDPDPDMAYDAGYMAGQAAAGGTTATLHTAADLPSDDEIAEVGKFVDKDWGGRYITRFEKSDPTGDRWYRSPLHSPDGDAVWTVVHPDGTMEDKTRSHGASKTSTAHWPWEVQGDPFVRSAASSTPSTPYDKGRYDATLGVPPSAEQMDDISREEYNAGYNDGKTDQARARMLSSTAAFWVLNGETPKSGPFGTREEAESHKTAGDHIDEDAWDAHIIPVTSMRKGAPFAGYDDFADCVAKNQDKDNPEAYCGSIKHKVEDKESSLHTAADELIKCAYPGCPHEFFYVADRGERAPYCLDHADQIFGHRAHQSSQHTADAPSHWGQDAPQAERDKAQARANEVGRKIYLQDLYGDGSWHIADDGRGPINLGGSWYEFSPEHKESSLYTADDQGRLPFNHVPDPEWGTVYGGEAPSYMTPDGAVWMFRKGQTVRFYNEDGHQVGPEQANVAPAVAYALSAGWASTSQPMSWEGSRREAGPMDSNPFVPGNNPMSPKDNLAGQPPPPMPEANVVPNEPPKSTRPRGGPTSTTPTSSGVTQGFSARRTAGKEWGEGVVGRGYLGFPGSEVIKVEPNSDYLMNGPDRFRDNDFTVTFRTEDGAEHTMLKPYRHIQDPSSWTYERKP